MTNLVPPHGRRLLPLLVVEEERQQGLEEAKILPGVRLSSKEASDLIMLAMGAFSPLGGFLKKQDYESVVAGIGGVVLFNPLMLAFTHINSMMTRGIGLIVAMFSEFISTSPFLKSGLSNLKLTIFGCIDSAL